MSSIFYLLIIAAQIGFVIIFAYYLRKYDARTTYQYVLCVLMLVLYLFEFVREIRIYQGNIALMNHTRLIILRMEHTVMGLFLAEVFKYVKICYNKTARKMLHLV